MTTPTHDTFAEMISAYALGALDRDERQTFEDHLGTCLVCQRELAEFRRVTAGLGLAADAVTPPASLKARTLAKATSTNQTRGAAVSVPAPAVRPRKTPRITLGWFTAAASLAAAIGAGMYAWSLRSQLDHLQQSMTELSDRANTLRNNLDDARRDAARLSRAVDILQQPGTIQVSLTGTGTAPGATGRAAFNGARGMVVSTERLPALPPGRVYQLWVIAGAAPPVGAGVFSVTNGAATVTATLPATFAAPSGTPLTIAVTQEPAGGSQTPTMPMYLMGKS
jgi:anti-sigma-K factor RskA